MEVTREPRGWMSVETSVESGYISRHDPEVRYKEWLRQFNQHLVKATGLTYEEGDDLPLRDWFDGGMKPEVAAKATIKRWAL